MHAAAMTHLVCSIMPRPYEVVDEEISRQGILPMVAPVKPYTLLALSCSAPTIRSACLPLSVSGAWHCGMQMYRQRWVFAAPSTARKHLSDQSGLCDANTTSATSMSPCCRCRLPAFKMQQMAPSWSAAMYAMLMYGRRLRLPPCSAYSCA